MGSKRAQKARKRVKRQARHLTRQARQTAVADQARDQARQAAVADDQDASASDPHIGYIADDDSDLVRHEGECVVAGSRTEMQRTVGLLCPGMKTTIHSVTFEQLFRIMNESGEVFRFDDEAYARFLEPARRRGIA